MPRTISSAQTFLLKLVLPPLCVLLGGIAVFSTWHVLPASIEGVAVRWLVPVAWIGATYLVSRLCVPLKRVRIDERNLYVSGFGEEVAMPLSAVRDVSGNRWINLHPVTIRFRRPTPFGERVTFVPKARWFSLGRRHPVVAELRAAAGLDRG